MNAAGVFKFTCKRCGGHCLTITHIWGILAGLNSEQWQEWGLLKDNHHWQYEFKEEIIKNEDDEVQRGDYSEFQEDDSASEPEQYEIYRKDDNHENDEYFVNCENCDREIEFGWSMPNRTGLIFPVDFSDFVVNDCLPDPKYSDLWLQRGWNVAEHAHSK